MVFIRAMMSFFVASRRVQLARARLRYRRCPSVCLSVCQYRYHAKTDGHRITRCSRHQ